MHFERRALLSAVLFTFLLGLNPSAFAGTVSGTVRAEGKQVEGAGSGGGAYESRRYKFVETVDYESMTDFAVYIEGPVPGAPEAEPKTVRVVVQKDAQFDPHVMLVEQGTTVEWPNEDDIYHNVFSASSVKPFDLGLYKDEIKKIIFDKPGRVDVFCSIHKNMNCIVLVLENPYFSRTDRRGRYRIENIPAGTYTLTAWHERMPPQTREITVPEKGEVEADFLMGIKGLPQY